jgi:hypothetical protein
VGHGTTLAHEDGVVGLPLRMYFLTSDGDRIPSMYEARASSPALDTVQLS